MENRLLHDLLDRAADTWPERTSLRYHEHELTFSQLAATTRSLAGAFSALGVGSGDRVAIYLPNRIEVVQAAIACSRVGAVFVPINPMLKQRQLGHILRDSGAKCVVMSASMLGTAVPAVLDSPHVETIITVDSAGPVHAPETLRHASFEKALTHAPAISSGPPAQRGLAAILYTSGSTGPARGVMVSHRNLVTGAIHVADYLQSRDDDRVLAALPLSFDYGLNQVLTSLHVGACCVLTNYSTAQALLQMLGAERITGLAGVPTMWSQLVAAEWPANAAAQLRYITNSGGALPTTVLRKLASRLPRTRIYCMYGLTEAFRSTYLDPALIDERPGSIGRAVPGQEVLVLREDGSRCAAGEVGELVHRGSFVALGYWNDQEQSKLRFRPWREDASEMAVWSGDLARTDEDGYLYFVGRRDAMIKTSGYRVSPTEVEEVIAEVPQVVQAVAVAIPDDAIGHRIVAAVVVHQDGGAGLVDTIAHHCRSQLPAYMVPSQVHLVDALPVGPNGKPDRAAIAAMLSARY